MLIGEKLYDAESWFRFYDAKSTGANTGKGIP
jgi:hypothetical protein